MLRILSCNVNGSVSGPVHGQPVLVLNYHFLLHMDPIWDYNLGTLYVFLYSTVSNVLFYMISCEE